MKRTMLIVSHALELGGAERSLIGFLEALDESKWEIDLFLLRQEGELMDAIPDKVHLLPQKAAYTVLAHPMKATLKEGHVLLTMARLYGKTAAVIYDHKHNYRDRDVNLEYSYKYTSPFMPRIQPQKEYDLAVSFLTPHYIVTKKVNAKKKIAWIHTDYSQVQIDILSETKMWKAYDYIASISEAVTKEFLKKFPTLKNRIILIKNILPEQLIKRQAESFSVEKEMNASGIKILSIGRFCYAKNFDNVPDICRQIRQNGLEVTWYLIGFGKNEKQIRKRICETGMKQYVKILGKKENPYPYIRACDVYVQPSRYEGNCVAVREAQMLGKPVIITGYPTAESQLRNGIDGIIVPLENRACGEKISEILREPKRLEKLVQECRKKDYSNRQEINKIECICRG